MLVNITTLIVTGGNGMYAIVRERGVITKLCQTHLALPPFSYHQVVRLKCSWMQEAIYLIPGN